MKILLSATLLAATTAQACPDYLNLELRELATTTRHHLCQLTEGKVVLVVNTASYCGYTRQFASLERLHRQYAQRGLVVLGFPSNDFRQEDGSEEKAAGVCRRDYGVTFPMFNFSHVRGAEANALFKALAAYSRAPDWNFNKYLLGRDGKLIARYGAGQTPDRNPLLRQIEQALSQ
ncbi:glutathione peroxidase [Aeromonas schubertii]|uniref:glutathione peroxidase n=1 Tax=Aeromonas schubertii TaxID=652 RepID=UPI00067EA581|nr:glutathione peroxidase [Aeromonas schubertii]KUE78897.1 glutathione peroxidase [Aeromonas schubertii]